SLAPRSPACRRARSRATSLELWTHHVPLRRAEEPMAELKIFSGNANRPLADEICNNVGVECGNAVVDKFRNGETKIKIQEHVRGADVFVIQSLSHPSNDHIMEMLIMIDA